MASAGRGGVLIGALLVLVAAPRAGFAETGLRLGGAGEQRAFGVLPLADGGRVIVGYSEIDGPGREDAWAARVAADGELVWQRRYGGNQGDRQDDRAFDIVPASGDGFLLSGWTESRGAGSNDLWLLRIDAEGQVLWQRTFGTQLADEGFRMVAAPGGGAVIVGQTESSGNGDGWLVKVDAQGEREWQRTFGGDADDSLMGIAAVDSGGYILAGNTGGRTSKQGDGWVIRVDERGREVWQRRFRASHANALVDIAPGDDGGFLVAGTAEPNDDKRRSTKAWVVSLDASGGERWLRTYGDATGKFMAIARAPGGDYALAGSSYATDGGPQEGWVVRLDAAGELVSQRGYGGTVDHALFDIAAVPDGFVATGVVDPPGRDNEDAWLLELDAALAPVPSKQ